MLYNRLYKINALKKLIGVLSTSSYEIFLVQMSACFLLKPESFAFIHNSAVGYFIWAIIIWVISLFGGVVTNRIKVKLSPKTI